MSTKFKFYDEVVINIDDASIDGLVGVVSGHRLDPDADCVVYSVLVAEVGRSYHFREENLTATGNTVSRSAYEEIRDRVGNIRPLTQKPNSDLDLRAASLGNTDNRSGGSKSVVSGLHDAPASHRSETLSLDQFAFDEPTQPDLEKARQVVLNPKFDKVANLRDKKAIVLQVDLDQKNYKVLVLVPELRAIYELRRSDIDRVESPLSEVQFNAILKEIMKEGEPTFHKREALEHSEPGLHSNAPAMPVSQTSNRTKARNTVSTQTLTDWLNNGGIDGIHIDGWALYRRTVNRLNTEDATGGAGAGCLAGLGIGVYVIFGGGWIAALFWIFAMIVDPGIRNTCFVTMLVVALAIGIIIYFRNSSDKRSSAKFVWNAETRRQLTQDVLNELGVRQPTSRERDVLDRARKTVTDAAGPGMKPPYGWFVDNESGISALPVGDAVLISRDALMSEFAEALVAHSWARAFMGDGILQFALLHLNKSDDLRNFPNQQEWIRYWHQQVYKADQFVVEIGYGQQLLAYLKRDPQRENNQPNYARDYPYDAERIDRLHSLGIG